MPDANGQMQLQDFRVELKNRGFDGFSDADLNVLINRGYFYVARKAPWYWGIADYTTGIPTDGQISALDTGAVTGFKSVEAVYYKQTADQTQRLKPVMEQDFRDVWHLDYASGRTGAPSVYYIDGNTLWVLPVLSPVGGSELITLRYNKRPVALIADTQVPITPVDYDEVILVAALVRAHKRANEPSLALVAQTDLEEAFEDMQDLESTRSQDLQERVRPDDTWQ